MHFSRRCLEICFERVLMGMVVREKQRSREITTTGGRVRYARMRYIFFRWGTVIINFRSTEVKLFFVERLLGSNNHLGELRKKMSTRDARAVRFWCIRVDCVDERERENERERTRSVGVFGFFLSFSLSFLRGVRAYKYFVFCFVSHISGYSPYASRWFKCAKKSVPNPCVDERTRRAERLALSHIVSSTFGRREYDILFLFVTRCRILMMIHAFGDLIGIIVSISATETEE